MFHGALPPVIITKLLMIACKLLEWCPKSIMSSSNRKKVSINTHYVFIFTILSPLSFPICSMFLMPYCIFYFLIQIELVMFFLNLPFLHISLLFNFLISFHHYHLLFNFLISFLTLLISSSIWGLNFSLWSTIVISNNLLWEPL